MFGINKNGTKTKVGVIMPSSYPASRTSYDNTGSGLTATNAQDAIDELAQGGGSYTEGDGIDINSSNVISVDTTFTEASTRANIASGDTFSTILGKIKKWFTDIPGMFVSKSGDTMTGALSVTSSSTATPLSLKGSSASTTYLSLLNSSGTSLGKLGASGGHPIWQYGGTNTNIATWDDLFMNRATPFYLQGNSKSTVQFTFTGLSASGSIHLFIFALTCSGEVLAACSASGFSSVKRTLLTDGDTYHLGLQYSLNNGYTFSVQVGTWSSVWGIFVHTDYPNAAMTMEWVS